MATNHKYITLAAIFLLAAVLSVQFSGAFILGTQDASVSLNISGSATTASPPNNAWLNASQTNTSVVFTVQFVSDNVSAACWLQTTVASPTTSTLFTGLNGTNRTISNNTLGSLYFNMTFVPAVYTWNVTCQNVTSFSDYNVSATRVFYYDNLSTENQINFPTSNIALTTLTPSPLQVNVTENWNATNITGVWFYYATGSTLSNNITLNTSALGATNVSNISR